MIEEIEIITKEYESPHINSDRDIYNALAEKINEICEAINQLQKEKGGE